MIRTANSAPMMRGEAVRLALPRRADSPAAFLRIGLRGAIAPSVVDSLAAAIQTQEGYYPGSLSYQNNNPGNLAYAGQPGAVPGAGGFAKFSSYDAGLAAEKNQITLDATRGADVNGKPINTVADLISSWAPASDGNNVPAYISGVSSATGFDPNAPLSSLGSGAAALPDPGSSASSIDLASITSGTIDLSGLGLASSVPVWWLVAGVFGVVLLARR